MTASHDSMGGERPAVSVRARSISARAAAILRHPGDPEAHDAASLRAHRWKVVRRGLAWGAILAVVGTTVLAIGAIALASARPGWWKGVAGDVAGLELLATDLESTVVEHASMVRPTAAGYSPSSPEEWRSDPWVVTVSSEQATAWLNRRFPVWLANRASATAWPDELKAIAVEFVKGEMHIGCELLLAGATRYLSADVDVGLREDGSLWVNTDWLYVGRLPVPAAWILKRAAAGEGSIFPSELSALPDASAALRALAGEAALAVHPSLSLGDGRRVRLLAVEFEVGFVRVTCRTEMNGKK